MDAPDDDRIDAPPPTLEWEEHIRPNGARIAFGGKPPSTSYGAFAVFFTAMCFFMIVLIARIPVYARVRGVGGLIALLFAAGTMWWKWSTTSVSAGAIDIDTTRVRFEPVLTFARTREFALTDVVGFSDQIETEMKSVAGNAYDPPRQVENKRWFSLHLRLASGEHVILASFAERSHSVFLAQRLDMLTDRARAVAGLIKVDRGKSRPYRS